ncbi:glycoside hydrolase family 19 protein [Luteibacter sp. CQ10]|uniref:glycoside hydrolase family 19 protein n=1 Tax=Luteibacter sp. CQ10 TaxID=2805821 RepID=UPI0034A23A53
MTPLPRRRALCAALAVASALISPLAAALDYDSSQIYVENCVVNWKNQTYRAKWWTPPGHTPDHVDTAPNPWDTSWERVATGTPTGCPGEPVSPPPGEPGPGNPGEPGTPGEPREVLLSRLLADEAALTASPLMQSVRRSIRTLDNATVEAVNPGRPQNPANVRRVESIVDEATFDYLFPLRQPEYTYHGFLQAVAKFPSMCADYDDGRDADAICRKTLATMFAHFAQETGGHESWREQEEYRQGLMHVREMGFDETKSGYNGECGANGWSTEAWPCGTWPDGRYKSYFGRGAKQLSYHFNYGPFSEAMYGDVHLLLDSPERVADTWLNLASASFFYTYPQPPKPSMLHVIDGTWQPNAADLADGRSPGFGVTTMIMNGGVECGGTGPEHAASANRITYYRAFAAKLGVPLEPNEKLGCRGMKEFAENGAGALPIYWENNWTQEPGCKLVTYQTAHSALKDGDYVQCVRRAFPDVEIVDDTQS